MNMFWIELAVVTIVGATTLFSARNLRLPGPTTLSVVAMTATILLLTWPKGRLDEIGLTPIPAWGDLAAMTLLGFVGFVVATGLASAVMSRFGRTPNIERLGFVRGNPLAYAGMLCVVWTSAAFGEEIVFRGFLQNGLIRAWGGDDNAAVAAIVVQAALFGLGHTYQGVAGMVMTGAAGLALGALTYMNGGNIWPAIVLHGLVNTIMLTLLLLQARTAVGRV